MSLPNGSGQIAPHSVEAEEATLGAILTNPEILFDVASILDTSDFFIVRNAWIWDAILAVRGRGADIDTLSVIDELRARGQLDLLGGAARIVQLFTGTPDWRHAETYARMVERAAVRRRLLAAAGEIAQSALEDNAELGDVIDRAESALFAVTERQRKGDVMHVGELASAYFDRVEKVSLERGKYQGLPTGYAELDNLLGGMHKKHLILIAARPGVGKTSLALNVALKVARQGGHVAVMSLEMDSDAVLNRICSVATGIDSKRLELGKLNEDEWARFANTIAEVQRLPLYLDDTPFVSIMQLRAKAHALKHRAGLDLLVLDYVQLLVADKRIENRTQELAHITRTLKILARELDAPVLACAQLSRAVEQRQDKTPMLSDLRESGSLEQDADAVMFLHPVDDMGRIDVLLRKNRNGPTGTAGLYFDRRCQRFGALSSIALGDIKPAAPAVRSYTEANDE